MKQVKIETHDFNKTNLVTTEKGRDHYECKICRCKGFRTSVNPMITMTDVEYKKSLKCSYEIPKIERNRPTVVLLPDMAYIGIREGVHEVVICPAEHIEDYADDVWVFSESRNEAVRIMDHEIYDLEY